MKISILNLAPALITVALLWAACTKSTPFGAELLEDQKADFAFTDTLQVRFKTLREDSIITNDDNSTANYFLCGQVNDPIFGKSKAEIFTLIQLGDLNPDLKNTDGTPVRFDSIAMYVMLNGNGVWGDTTQKQTVKVFRLNDGQQVKDTTRYYSVDKLAADQEIGSTEVFIQPRTLRTLVLGDTIAKNRDSIGKAAYIKIPLSLDFAESLMRDPDSLVYASDDKFWQKLRGLKIATTTADPRLMIGFDLNNTKYSRIVLSYTRNDTSHLRKTLFFVGGNKFVHMKHDYAGTPVEQAFGVENGDYGFVQGMAGTKVQIEIPNAPSFENIVVNKAELELYAAALPGDNLTWFPPATQFVLYDTSRIVIPDVQYSLDVTQTLGRFGGVPEKKNINGQDVWRYKLTLTQRFQDMVDQKTTDLKGTTLVLRGFPQIVQPGRTVFLGQKPGNAFPAKLTLKYTKI